MEDSKVQDTIKSLVNRRKIAKSRLTRIINYMETYQHDPLDSDLSSVNVRRDGLLSCWNEFETVQTELELIDSSKSEVQNNAEWNDFETKYFDTLSKMNSLIAKYDNINNSNNGSLNNTTGTDIKSEQPCGKLPTIKLPEFKGSYEEFGSFFELFTSLIDSVDNIPAIQKFHYLKSSLKGDAKEVIDSLELTSENYPIALSLLKDRYENKKIVKTKHVQGFFSLPKMDKESAISLRKLIDSAQKHLRALKALGEPTDYWDTLLIHIMLEKVDSLTKRSWETEVAKNDKSTFKDFIECLNTRCKILEACSSKSTDSNNLKLIQSSDKIRRYQTTTLMSSKTSTKQIKCVFCGASHYSNQCPDFLKLPPSGRYDMIIKLKLCRNCLRDNHSTKDCKSAYACSKCNLRHHSTLHDDNFRKSLEKVNSESKVSNHCATNPTSKVILATAVVDIVDNQGSSHPIRVLLDSGSESSFISEQVAKSLGLRMSKCNTTVAGIENTCSKVSHCLQATINSRYNFYRTSLTFLVSHKITERLPVHKLNSLSWKIPENIFMADPNFDTPNKIDALIGAEIFFDILLSRKQVLGEQCPLLQETVFGWIISGRNSNQNSKSFTQCHLSVNPSLDSILTKFWRIEDMDNFKELSTRDQLCENMYSQTTSRQADGRFVVSLPLNENRRVLGDSKENAIKRFLRLEKRLDNDSKLKTAYSECIDDYIAQNHMEQVFETEPSGFYMPHHPVIKETSSTTKVRVVFDASAKSSTNISLNDILLVGPTVQRELFSILMSFRIPRYVFATDIKQMYRQIRVDSNDCNLQKIVWRKSKFEEIKVYRHLTVTFGTAPAPFLATKTLITLAEREKDAYPLAYKIITNDSYVDDFLTGFDDVETALEAQRQLIELLASGGFKLHKWIANSDVLLQSIPDDDKDSHYFITTEKESIIKTLGLIWDPKDDTFNFTLPSFPDRSVETKRTILSDIGRLFDPLGLIAPIIARAKITMQHIWQTKSDWDVPLREDILTPWLQYRKELNYLNKIKLPRRITDLINYNEFQLFGFCDSSEQAYGACLYIRTVSKNGEITAQLLCAKSRVAPLKKQTLPRLELCGALLLAKLTHKIVKESKISFKSVHLWTDSTVVLAWIKSESTAWKTFVSNRIAEIQRLTHSFSWDHVKSLDNPADILSRGCTPSQLVSHQSWWSGPWWMTTTNIPFKNCIPESLKMENEERSNVVKSYISTLNSLSEFIGRYSSFSKLVRVTAYIFRFINNCKDKSKREICSSKTLKCPEYTNAQLSLIKVVQTIHFTDEIKILKTSLEKPESNLTISKNSHLKSFNPFLDSQGILRVGGRLAHAHIPYHSQHPIILPSNNHLTYLIIHDYHLSTLHSGPQLLLAAVRLRYWPIRGKALVKKVVKRCVACAKVNPKPLNQIMGNLPTDRVTINKPFTNCGLDFCGPFSVKSYSTRKAPVVKIYICLFVCFSVKAIHLEICHSLTSKDFIAALKRFIARRGYPSTINCDNATTFIGAKNELAKLKSLVDEDEVGGFLTCNSIIFKHIPARSPSFGGLWEAGVKTVKNHLKRVIGNSLFTAEEFSTLIIEIEACVNSRPLVACSSNSEDPYPLTPAHFLVGESLIDIPEPTLTNTPTNLLTHWQIVQQKKQIFWRRWSQEYLSTLQNRSKWTKDQPNVKIGSIVVIKEDNTPPLKWKIGRVAELHPGKDGKCRVVTVENTHGKFTRSINKICLLPIENYNE